MSSRPVRENPENVDVMEKLNSGFEPVFPAS